MGMMRVLRRAPNPYHLKLEPPIMMNRKRLLDSKSSEESSENTDDDDSPDTEEEQSRLMNPWDAVEESQLEEQSAGRELYRRRAFRNWDDSNAAEEDYSDDDLGPVLTLPDPLDF
jgi:hypothetical protein